MVKTGSSVSVEVFSYQKLAEPLKSEKVMNCAKSVGSIALSGISQVTSATANLGFATASTALGLTKDVGHIGLQTVTTLSNFAGHSALWVGTLGVTAGLFDAYTCANRIPTPWKDYNVYRHPKTLLENAKIFQEQGGPGYGARWGDYSPKPMNDMVSEQLGLCLGMLVAAPAAAKLCYTVGDLAKRVDRLF